MRAIPRSVTRYGQLSPLLAPVYLAYGDALLRLSEIKADALAGGGAGGSAGGGEDSDSSDDDDDGDGEGGGSGASAAGEDGEEVADEDGDGDADDEQIAFESLECARVIVSRLPTTPVNRLMLARVHIRLGDSCVQRERFTEASHEYQRALGLTISLLAKYDRMVADILYRLGTTYVQLANEKDISEATRSTHLRQAMIHMQVQHCTRIALALQG